MSNNPTFTIAIQPIGDHLQVTIKELGITVETAGNTRHEAEQAATRAITEYMLKQREQRSAKAS